MVPCRSYATAPAKVVMQDPCPLGLPEIEKTLSSLFSSHQGTRKTNFFHKDQIRNKVERRN